MSYEISPRDLARPFAERHPTVVPKEPSGRFEDHRGVIQDMTGRIDAVTRITTVAGAVRGNHFHEKTTQWTLLLSGSLLMASGDEKKLMRPGDVIKHEPGVPHAWKAISDSECIVFTKGPRAGEDYESDVIRLEEPLL